ncbi:Wzz/FepE/Etk N-terminal domain-containing protein [soil metagenome]
MELNPQGRDATLKGTEPSLVEVANTLLRRRRLIATLFMVGAIAGGLTGFLSERVYRSTAVFMPQASGGALPSGLLAAASQFGVRVPSPGGSWGAPVYVELLKSNALLEPLARDTVIVAEEGGRTSAVMDLLKVRGATPAEKLDRAVLRMQTVVGVSEDLQLGAVKLAVSTPWPSVSLELAKRAVAGVNRFNLTARKSEAAAERQFADVQASEARDSLRAAENRLEDFQERNRRTNGSDRLGLELDRLRRDVTLRQQVYTALVQSRDEARLREVRDTPVITILQEPRLPVLGESRKTVQKAMLGGIVGAMIAILIAFLSQAMAGARRAGDPSTREMMALIDGLTPAFLKRRRATG